ncbi:MAG TPA: pentapeptide repeat-containing protein [Alphaproteobacteria bacterium]|nr:pentapeptide repeat-containing protein [Alphaproteobacteria bacterium]
MAIEGLSAYQVGYSATYLQVAKVQTTGKTYQLAHGGSGTVEDMVTLSLAAQAILSYLSSNVPLKGDLTSINGGSDNLPNQTTEQLLAQGAAPPLARAEGSHNNFIGIDLSGQNLSGGDFRGIILNYANLAGADLSYAVLTGVSFANADVSGANFQGADLRGANFAGATGLRADQLINARVDMNTTLPIGVVLK